MSTIVPGPAGLAPPGQPEPMREGDYAPASYRPRLFGQGYRELSGVPRLILVPNPAAGAEWTYTHSGPSWILFRFGVATLATSAVVATRGVSLQVSHTGNTVGLFSAVATQAAGATAKYSFAPVSNTFIAGAFVLVPLPAHILVKDGMSFGSVTDQRDAGDQWSGIALYAEEFTDKCLDYL